MKITKTMKRKILATAALVFTLGTSSVSAFADTTINTSDIVQITNSAISTLVVDKTSVINVKSKGDVTVNKGDIVFFDNSGVAVAVVDSKDYTNIFGAKNAAINSIDQLIANNSVLGTLLKNSVKSFNTH